MHRCFVLVVALATGCSCNTSRQEQIAPAAAPPTTPVPATATGTATATESESGPGGQRAMYNREALIPPQCYTRTDGRHNPCYVCHQRPIEGDGHENRMDDGYLQGDYNFSEFALENHWSNLFVDRRAEVAAISDEDILAYVAEDNYTPLLEQMRGRDDFRGYRPDLADLALGAAAFDERGLARDGSAWVAFNYMPMPSTFWPTNGSTDDVMIRLPERFRTDASGRYVEDVYFANLALLELAIKNVPALSTPPIDERRVGADLDGDGRMRTTRRIVRRDHYVGAASPVELHSFLYPEGTELLHTVRYLGIDDAGNVVASRRLKELRYMVKRTFIPTYALAGIYDDEIQEKLEGNPPYYADFRERGIDNGFGWLVQGYIEGAEGALRPSSYEENLFCMGCHSTIGSTIDHVFSFARKVDGAEGWGYVDLRGMPDAPSRGESEGQILTYLRRAGGGSEFRANDEMRARWFREDGGVDEARVRAAPDVYALITPSRERALLLNKTYRVIVREQSFVRGRDATVAPPEHVFERIDREQIPLAPEHRFAWDIRIDWPGE